MFSRISNLLQNPLQVLYTLPAILIGLTVHEWAHAFAAYKLGDPTARDLGRMTLNPLAHIDPVGFLCLLLVGFGWAKPVPVVGRKFKHYKRDEIIVSLAGIAMNLVTAFVFTFVLYAGYLKWNLGGNTAFLSILSSIVSINIGLALFNLIPLSPLDGSHVLECLLGHIFPRVFLFLRQYGRYILLVLLLTGAVSGVLGTAASWIFQLFSRAAFAVLG